MAQFKVGERVRFLRERQEGVIQRILSPTKLEVLVDDFVEMEVDASEVVHIHAGEAVLRKEDEVETEASKIKVPLVEREPTFVIHRTANRDYELWILNLSQRELYFACYQRAHGKFKGVNAAGLQAGERRMIALMPTQEFHNVQSIILQVLQYPLGDKARPMPMLSLEVNCKTQILNEKSIVIPEVGVDGWEFVLEEKAIQPLVEAEAPSLIRPPQVGPEVVDLHIEKLVKSLMGMDSAQMLAIQLEHFEKHLTDSQARKQKSIVFIHGSGSGRLRKELHQRLRGYKFVKEFEQADPLRYGNGATIVYF